jgi:SAM-dependent methyltransferase
MAPPHDVSPDQSRWNELGSSRLREMRQDPERFRLKASPHKKKLHHDALLGLLEPLKDKRILEVGCGRGEFGAFLGTQGAHLVGTDLGPDLAVAAREMALINEIDARYLAANASALPFADASFDVVLGVNVLHHLSETHLARALREAHRVLRPGGVALICEPVENSAVLGLVTALVPKPASGRGRPRRPSILERKAWKAFQETLDDRSLSTRELVRAGAPFAEVDVQHFGFLIRLKRFVSKERRKRLPQQDARLLRRLPWLGRYGRHVLVEYRKAAAPR